MKPSRASRHKTLTSPSQKLSQKPKGEDQALPSHPLLDMQQTLGNRAVGRMLQAKLKVGQPNDQYEQEADRVAEQVTNMPEPVGGNGKAVSSASGVAQRDLAEGQGPQEEKDKKIQRQEEGEDEKIQRQEDEEDKKIQRKEEEEEPVQTKAAGQQTPNLSPKVESNIHAMKGAGQALPEASRAELEPRFGYDFSHVRVHTDTPASETAHALKARAFTVGHDIAFNSGEYAPESTTGKKLLAHELTHVIQQDGQTGTLRSKGIEVQKTGQPMVQGIFGKIWGGIKKVGGAIGKAAKWVGGGVKKIAGKVWSGAKWFGKQLWTKLQGIYYRAKHWVTRLPERLGRLVEHIWNGVKSLKPWSIDWWKSLGNISTWKGFLSWLGTTVLYSLEIAGVGEAYETLMDFIKFNTRPLTGREIGVAKQVFGNAIDYKLVRVDEHALLGPSWTGRAYVSFHTINAWGALTDRTLIHELTHVWQYERIGAIYMPRAIHAQQRKAPEGYDYGGVARLQANLSRGIWAFNMEEQGEILADYYTIINGITKERRYGDITDLPIYEHYVKQVRR